jgi:aspartyl-tRNA(Asn)/glutamyl-tRNA(Gln) amidotransferase subunit B
LHYQHNKNQEWSVDPGTGVVSYDGEPRFQTVIGLEIHAQLDITTKLFSGCPIDSSSSNRTGRSSKNLKPNTSVWPFDVGVPGFLPRLSEEAVRSAVLAAGAMKCYLPPVSRFERKHYFYADAPLGYQVTQQRWPIARDGILTCHYGSNGSNSNSNKDRKKKKNKNQQQKSDDNNNKFILRIERIQLEQDTGKTLADVKNPITLRKESLVDFNRAGRALIEIVSHPDLRSSTGAAIAVETIRNLLKHIGTCDGKMEEGSLRCDLNVSIAPIIIDSNNGTEIDIDGNDIISKTGNRVEVKNLNSIRQVQAAAEYEAIRQSQAILLDNSPTSQETRTFDVKGNRTVVIRTKEGAKDYRFMPEPDLPPLILNEETLDEKDVETYLDIHLPELPDDARQRLIDDYGLSEYLASVLTGDPPAIEFFDESVCEAIQQLNQNKNTNCNDREKRKIPETVANLLCNELFALVREFELQRLIEEGLVDIGGGGGGGDSSSIRFSRVTGSQLGEVVALLLEGLISNTMAKQLLRALYSELMDESLSTATATATATATRPTKTISPRKLALERGFQLITDTEKLDALCRETIENSPREMERYKLGGKFAKKITKFLLGKAMGTSRGNAHPERLQEVLVEILNDIQVAPSSEDD